MRVLGVSAAVTALTLLVGCNSQSGLTTEKAQEAVDAASIGGAVRVLGVQERPQDNAAVADLQLSNVPTKTAMKGLISYTGPATAEFTHYSDGRWVLTRIHIVHGDGTESSWRANIEVK